MQTLLDGHDTPLSAASVAPGGSGVRWIDQLVPFQRSTNGSLVHLDTAPGQPAPNSKDPTVVQAVADVHDTALSRLLASQHGDPAGLGIRWIDHRLPFQRSTRATP